MKSKNRLALVLLAIVALPLLSACGGSSDTSSESGPALVEPIEGTDLSRITVTAKAAERLDIQTTAVQGAAGDGKQTVIPYAAVLYQPNGETWTYVSPKPLTFVRERIVIDRIDGDRVVLSKGPAPGTKVATVGVAELFGAESGIGQ